MNLAVRLWLCTVLLLNLASPVCLAASGNSTFKNFLNVNVTGISSGLQNQVQSFVTIPDRIDRADIENYIELLKSDAEKSLQPLGYYNAKARATHTSNKISTRIELRIDAGKPVRITHIHLSIEGSATTDPDFKKTLQALPIKRGAIFNHGNYERSKDLLSSRAQSLGYFQADFKRSQVLVRQKKHAAEVFLVFNSGERYNISTVTYNTTLFKKPFLKRWQPFEQNVPYRASHVRQLTENLQNSGYFKHVRVKPLLNQADGNEIPLQVDLQPSSENVVSLGIGYATDSGPRVKGNWLRPHTNRHGHILETSASVSLWRKELTAGYRVPHLNSPATGRYTFDIGLSNQRTDDTFSQLRTMDIGDHRTMGNGWTRDFFLRWENERFRIGDQKSTINLLLPGIGVSRSKSSGSLLPDKGTSYSFSLLAGSKKLLSDLSMIRVTGSAKLLNSWHVRHYLIARADAGFLITPSFSMVPTSHRFFAGGDNSVRGFSFQSISPVNSDNELIGGQFLTTASLEYNYYFRKNWAVALFADTGRAFIDADERYRLGIGTGIRWISPLGPLRIDLGYGVTEASRPLRLHLAIGPLL
ncbi:hypothetical protein AB833_30650 [Chromatiales bacterium (ex Bugula neritina AB1)]|nr:hypothetical protein AB833_30650 [Chromatiales bacterium (ex Bugula neritina AB1)]